MALDGRVRSRGPRLRLLEITLLVLVAGCGAKSALEITAARDASVNDAPRLDAPGDAGSPDTAVCVPEGERCNGRDDDCDGMLDEGLGFGPLGEVIVLRSTELDTGDCGSCSWAWEPVLAPNDAGGLTALFRIGIYGGREQPNVITRALDRRGEPVGPLTVTPDLVILSSHRLRTSRGPGDPTLVAAQIRRGIGAREVGGWLTVDRAGVIETVSPPYRASPPIAVLGDRVISIDTDSRRAVLVHTASLDGSDPTSTEIEFEELLTVFPGFNETEVGLVVLTYVGAIHALHFVSVNGRGEIVAGPRDLEHPYRSYPRLVGTSEGFLFVLPGDRDEEASIATMGHDGATVLPLRPVPELHGPLSDSGLSDGFAHHPTAPELVLVTTNPYEPGDMHVVRIDEHAEILAEWSGPAPGGYVVYPEVLFTDDGRLLIAWHDVEADATPNRVYVREFGCSEAP
jgi:hypothetical protein